MKKIIFAENAMNIIKLFPCLSAKTIKKRIARVAHGLAKVIRAMYAKTVMILA